MQQASQRVDQTEKPVRAEHCTLYQRSILLDVARRTLVRGLARQEALPFVADQVAALAVAALPESDRVVLLTPAAAFVTLWRRDDGDLRGCRGETTASRPLAAAVAHMALAAAGDDPRFSAVTARELPQLRIEISVLSACTPIAAADVEIGRHGLLVVQGSRRGLLLPQVAVEHHLSQRAFLAAVCSKAGLSPDAWRSPQVALWAFTTESWEEEA